MKKAIRSAVSVIISLIIVFSATFSVTGFAALSESNDIAEMVAQAKKYYSEPAASEVTAYSHDSGTRSLAVYDYLADYLLEYGKYDSDVYFIGGVVDEFGVTQEYIIFYDESTEEIYFCSDILGGNFYLYMIVSPYDTDSYAVQGYDPFLDYRAHGTVYPQSYPHLITVTGDPDNSDYGSLALQEFQNLVNQAMQLTLPFWNELLYRNTSLNMGSMGFTRLYTPNPIPPKKTYTISFDANGGTGNIPSQSKEKRTDMVLTNAVPRRYGYKFLGWSTDKNATEPEYYSGGLFTVDSNTTLYAVWEKDYSVKIYDASVKIVNNPGTVTVNYKTVIYLSAETKDMPEGAYIRWFINGQDAGVTDSKISFEGTDTVVISVKAFDKDGEIMRNVDGNEIADSEKIIVNNGFFHRLIQAIRRLFFGVSTYQQ